MNANVAVYGMAVSGEFAYLAQGEAGLQVLNISAPANVRAVSRYGTLSGAGARGVAVSGNYAYVAISFGLLETPRDPQGFIVLDFGDPENPVRVGQESSHYELTSITISGEYAYVTDYREDLQVIDISDPSSPQRVGGFESGVDLGA